LPKSLFGHICQAAQYPSQQGCVNQNRLLLYIFLGSIGTFLRKKKRKREKNQLPYLRVTFLGV